MDDSHNPLLVFEFTDAGREVNYTFTNPVKTVVADHIDGVHAALEEIERAVASGLYAAGYISYEAAPAFNPAFAVKSDRQLPLVWFGLFREPRRDVTLIPSGSYRLSPWEPTVSAEAYNKIFANLQRALSSGEIEQVNYTIRLRALFSGDDFTFYRRLAKAQRAGYHAYFNLGRYRILSTSPELFFQWDGRRITMRPMKGTIARGRFQEEDERRQRWLYQSEKNRAENRITVERLCKELEAIAERETINVTKWFEIERYPTVFQMTSTVEAITRPSITLKDVFSTLFPSSSITGVPKVQAMQRAADLEILPREVYCGTIGFVTPKRNAVFNVAIRTAWLDGETGVLAYGTGSGITVESTAEDEYHEVLTKTAVLKEAEADDFHLLETIRLEKGKYALLPYHLKRLTASAEYFGIPLSVTNLQDVLTAHAERYPTERRRVRLLVSPSGDTSIGSSPLDDRPREPLPVVIAHKPVSKQNRFLYHKTTNRDVYDARKRVFPDVFDVLLWNEQGELTEFTIGNFVAEYNGALWTPPVTCGLLPGTMRADLIERGLVKERVLTRSDLKKCTRFWLINSVRGWVPVHFVK